MNPTQVIELVALAARIGIAVADVIRKGIEAGDSSAVDALRKVLPAADVQLAEDLALMTAQRSKAVETLQPSPYSEGPTRRITMPETGGPKVPR